MGFQLLAKSYEWFIAKKNLCRAPTEEFNWSQLVGCPVYVLDAALQDGHKIPK
jgi:hypothetical protein